MAIKNRALALMVLAGMYTRQNKLEKAAKAVHMASVSSDFGTLVQATRQVASTKATAANKGRLQRAAAWPFRQSATVGVGDDLREEPSEQNHLREVQEGAIEDDLELMGLSDEGTDEMADFDDFDPSLTDGVDNVEDASAEDDDEEDEDEGGEEEASVQRASVLARAMRNLAARQSAAKKAKAKKKARK